MSRSLRVLLALYLAWGSLYVWRTSFAPQGERVFCLWDDAMISMQYARNLARGEGLVWNAGGERVQGFSNPGVTLLMAAVHLLPLDATQTSLVLQLLGLGMLLALALLAAATARRLFPDEESVGLAAVAAIVACAPVAIWTLQGSDVPFVSLWLLGGVFLLARRDPGLRSWPAAFPAWLALGPLIRLDAAILGAALVAASAALGEDTLARRLGRLAKGGAALAAALAALLGLGALYYGDPLPNTYYLKATGSPRALVLASGFEQLARELPRLALLGLLAGIACARAGPIRARWLGAAVATAAVGYNVWVGGDWAPDYESRFVVPVLPLLLVLAVGPVSALASARWRRAAAIGLGALLGLVASPWGATLDWIQPNAWPMYRDWNLRNYVYARYLRDHTARSTSLAVHWGGVPVYFSERRAIDALGRSDAHIARMQVPRFIPAHSKWDWDYVLRVRRPDVFLEETRGLREEREFLDGYYQVRTLDGLEFFLRRDSVDKLLDRNVVLVDISGTP